MELKKPSMITIQTPKNVQPVQVPKLQENNLIPEHGWTDAGYTQEISYISEHTSPSEITQVTWANLERDNIELQIYRNRSEMEAQIILKDTGEVIDRIPVSWKARENKLDYLSVSKIQAYEQCPSAFYKQYMSDENIEEDTGNYYTKFGSILHTVVEKASSYYKETGLIIDPIAIYNEEWAIQPIPIDEEMGGFDTYREGKELIADYFSRNPVDKRTDNALFIEKEWRGELGGTTFGLMIDYVGIMKHDQNIGILKDYKTNRVPFTPSELESSFQLKVYELVLRRFLAPQVKEWIAGYEMFRFGWQQCPPWTKDDLQEVEDYIRIIAQQIANDNTWEERLNKYCGYRKCRLTCKAYKDYVENPKRYIDIIQSDNIDLAKLDKERELLSAYEKIAKTRKDELSDILKNAVQDAVIKGKKLILNGDELQLYSAAKQSYRYYDTRNVLLAHNKLDLLDDCLSIAKTNFDKKISKNAQLKLELANCMNTNYASPYIVKKKAK